MRGRGRQAERVDRDAMRRRARPGRGGQALRRRRGCGQGTERAMAAPERGKDADWRAVGLGKLRAVSKRIESRGIERSRLRRRSGSEDRRCMLYIGIVFNEPSKDKRSDYRKRFVDSWLMCA